LSAEYLQSFVGKRQTLLTETIENDGFIYGYGENYVRIKMKMFDGVKANEFYSVKILKVENDVLIGQMI
jgi:tRNA A37 methylthiotransferase MiaB